jgi:hypothetical protein
MSEATCGATIPDIASLIRATRSLLRVGAVQDSLEISPTVKYSDNDHFAAYDPECNRCPPLKPDGPQARTNVITARASRWGIFQRHARGLYPIDVPSGNCMTGSFGDIPIKLE